MPKHTCSSLMPWTARPPGPFADVTAGLRACECSVALAVVVGMGRRLGCPDGTVTVSGAVQRQVAVSRWIGDGPPAGIRWSRDDGMRPDLRRRRRAAATALAPGIGRQNVWNG